MRKRRGFTLLELLIAASIFSIIILSLYSAFQTGVLSYRKIDSVFEVYQSARIILNRIELDLKNCFAYTNEDSKFQGNDKSLEFFSVVDYFEEGQPRTNICRVKYELTGEILKRTCYRGLYAIKDDLGLEEEGASYDVRDISFEYVTGKTDESLEKNILPLAVKIKLSLIEKSKEGENIIEFNKTIALPLAEKISPPPSS